MKTIFIACALSLCMIGQALGQTQTLTKLPEDIASFTAFYLAEGKTPEGTALSFVTAMLIYKDNQPLGEAAFRQIMDKSWCGAEGTLSSMFLTNLKNYLLPKPYLGASYIQGTTAEAGYALPALPYTVRMKRNAYSEISETQIKLYMYSTGAETPRPITLHRDAKGYWKVNNYSSLLVGVQAPK